jgi:hypothetical protein
MSWTVSSPDAAIKEEAISSSAASQKRASGQEEDHNDAGRDDQTKAIEPTRSEPVAPSADNVGAGEAAKSHRPEGTSPNVTPQVAGAAGAGIRNKSVEFVGYIPGTRVPVLRYRTPNKVKRQKKSLKHGG